MSSNQNVFEAIEREPRSLSLESQLQRRVWGGDDKFINWNKNTVKGFSSALVLLCCLELCHSPVLTEDERMLRVFRASSLRHGRRQGLDLQVGCFTLESIFESKIINTSSGPINCSTPPRARRPRFVPAPSEGVNASEFQATRLDISITGTYYLPFSSLIPIYRRKLPVSYCHADGCSALEEY
jgi:hypothetical protein